MLLWLKQAILASWTRVKQELQFKIFAKTGAGIKLFGVGVESMSKNSDHLWFEKHSDRSYYIRTAFVSIRPPFTNVLVKDQNIRRLLGKIPFQRHSKCVGTAFVAFVFRDVNRV